ncbi:MAG TPA: FliH/SctL family protein [Phycisphaerae bacterium]|jgi:flagellar assembly protein FliH
MKAQQGGAQRVRESAIVMDLSDLEQEAAKIVATARAEAARLMAEGRTQAEREKQRIREDAREAGHKEGLEAGLMQGRQQGHDESLAAVSSQLKDVSARWSQTLELLQQHMPAHIADSRTDLVRLAVAIAGRVTRAEALRNRQVAPAIVEETLRMLNTTRRIALHVHPSEIETLEAYLPDLLTKMRSIEEIELTPDDTVTPGGCIVRFGAGQIDARIETQLQRIADELLGHDEEAHPT